MLPTAGLFLPDTLHRRQESAPSQIKTDGARLKYFQRQISRSQQEPRQPANLTFPVATKGSSEGTTDSFPSLITAFDFADFVASSSKASSDSGSFAILVHRVRQDVSEASRLYLSPAVKNFLEDWPDRKSWIDAILVDVRRTLNEIGGYVETIRITGDDGGAAGLKRKFEWVLGHQKKLSNKQQLLSTCHQSLMTAVHIMQTVELCGVSGARWEDPIYEAPVQPWVKNEDAHVLRGPYSRREYRLSQKNLSMSSLQLHRPENDGFDAASINSMPAELPGSTPDDLVSSWNRNEGSSPREYTPYRRSVGSRTSFGTTSSQFASPNTPLNEISRMNAHSQEFVSSQVRPLGTQPGISRSANHLSTERTTLSDKTRASLDGGCPQGTQEQLHISAVTGIGPRSSMDFVHPLPTLAEKSVERNDSTKSTVDVITVSQVAKRYHANPIYIQGKHQSLPTELPHLKSHSSLTEDLADWMLTGAQSEKRNSKQWEKSSILSSPSMSVVSCPAVTDRVPACDSKTSPCPDEMNDLYSFEARSKSEDATILEQTSSLSERDDELWLDLDQHPLRSSGVEARKTESNGSCHLVQKEHAVSVRSTSSNITRKPLPAGSTVTARFGVSVPVPSIDVTSSKESNPTPAAPSVEETRLIPSNFTLAASSSPQETCTEPTPALGDMASSSDSSTPFAPTITLQFSSKSTVTTTATTTADDKPSIISEVPAICEDMQATVDEKLGTCDDKLSITNTEPSIVNDKQAHPTYVPQRSVSICSGNFSVKSRPEGIVPKIPQPAPAAKPMSAQARRRAAHQRRMELAFGES